MGRFSSLYDDKETHRALVYQMKLNYRSMNIPADRDTILG